MSETDVAVVLAHGGWADGSSWSKVIAGLRSERVKAVAAPLPLTSLADDVAALDQMLERVEGPVVVAGNAYAGAVIASTGDENVASLVSRSQACHAATLGWLRPGGKGELLWLTFNTAPRTWMV